MPFDWMLRSKFKIFFLMKYFAIVFFCFSIISLKAQTDQTQDLIYLKDGSVLIGKQLYSGENEPCQIRLKSGVEVAIPCEEIKVIREKKQRDLLVSNGKTHPIKGSYASFQIQFLFGNGADNNFDGIDYLRDGLGLHLSVGHLFSNKVSLGGGIGLDLYERYWETDVFLPLYMESRGAIPVKNIALTYKLQTGYTIAAKKESEYNSDEQTKAGFMFHPSIGIQFGGRRDSNFGLALGFKQQFLKRETEWGSTRIEDKVIYRSLMFGIGWLF